MASSQNDYAFDGSVIQRVSSAANYNITGISYPIGLSSHTDGRFMRIYNINAVGGSNITLVHNSGLSSAGNKLWCVQQQNIVIGPSDYVELIYDSTDYSGSAGGSGWRVH